MFLPFAGKWKISKEIYAILATLVLVMVLSSLACYLFGVQKTIKENKVVIEEKGRDIVSILYICPFTYTILSTKLLIISLPVDMKLQFNQ